MKTQRLRIHLDEDITLCCEQHQVAERIALERRYLPSGARLPPVILVHGFAQNRFTWDCSQRSMQNYLAAQGFDVWNMELRGHGNSTGQGAESFSEYVKDMIDVAHYIDEPAFWVGHSLGGATVYASATQMNPLKCRGIIGIAALYHFGNNPIIRQLCHLTQFLGRLPLIGNLQVRTRMGGVLLSKLYGISDVVGYTFPLSGWWPGTVEPELFDERMRLGMDWTSVQVWKEMAAWGTQQAFPYAKEWSQLDIPLLVLLGDKDHLLTIRDGRPAYLESGSKDKTLVIFDDFKHESHYGHLDIILGKKAPQYVWPTLSDWLKAHSL